MQYSYFLVSFARGKSQLISTNVYAKGVAGAKEVGAKMLTQSYGITVPPAGVTVIEVSSIKSDRLTTDES